VTIRVVTLPRISWALFRPVASIPDTTEEAQIAPEFPAVNGLRPERTPGGRFRLPSFVMHVRVNRRDTMVVRTANKTADLLKHEQGHYDLLVLVTRAFARELESLEAASVAELGSLLGTARQSHDERAQAVDAKYDSETDHSRNRAAQLRWNSAIVAALAQPRCDTIANLPL